MASVISMSNLQNSFQGPNEYIDHYCAHLTGAEFKILMVATRKICGFREHRKTMRDRISLRQFQRFTGIKDRTTLIAGLKKLNKLGIIKPIGRANQHGQEWKLIRHMPKFGQQEIFDQAEKTRWSGNQTRVVWKPDHSGLETRPTKQIFKQISKVVNVTATTKTTLNKNQMQLDFKKPKEVVGHLREIASHEGNGKAAADIVLRILEQLWSWGFRDEILKSWKWYLYAAATWPAAVNQAWGEVKTRKLERGDVKNPGALLTYKIKEYTINGNSKDQN